MLSQQLTLAISQNNLVMCALPCLVCLKNKLGTKMAVAIITSPTQIAYSQQCVSYQVCTVSVLQEVSTM